MMVLICEFLGAHAASEKPEGLNLALALRRCPVLAVFDNQLDQFLKHQRQFFATVERVEGWPKEASLAVTKP